jgi:superfamily I DNA/RNA helicase
VKKLAVGEIPRPMRTGKRAGRGIITAGNKPNAPGVENNMSNRTPTPEQQKIIDAALAGGNVVIQAGAGTGKTSTLRMLAKSMPDSKILYLVYNRAAKDEAERDEAEGGFPANVTVKTGHGLAYGPIVMGRKLRNRLNGNFQKSSEVAGIIGTTKLILDQDLSLSAYRIASIALATVRRFCYSADTEISRHHVPFQNNILGAAHDKLASHVLPYARKAWDDINSKTGRIRMEHDHYLKIYGLTNPTLRYDVILLDEAQDSNPCIVDIVSKQAAQQIVVGDGCQQMYSWRGAVDALATWPNATQLFLTQSWRFGQAIADEANTWLSQLDTPMRLSGNPGIESVIETIDGTPDAVLCRTNGGALGSAMNLIKAGNKVALVGGGKKLADLAYAALDLMAGRRTSNEDLYAFTSWDEVRDYVANEEGVGDLKTIVKLIDDHGADVIIATTKRLVAEEQADVTISTAHKAKGREWNRVRLADDFFVAAEGETLAPAEIMIGYVAATRAKLVLDRTAIAD